MNYLEGEIKMLHWVMAGKRTFLFIKLNYTFVLTLKIVHGYFFNASECCL